MTSLTCPGCGQPVQATWSFCGRCRRNLQPTPPPTIPPPPAQPATPPAPAAAAPAAAAPVAPVAPTRRRLSRTTLVVAGIILLAVLFCILSIKVAQKIALMNAAVPLPTPTPETSSGVEMDVPGAATEPVIIEVPSLAPEMASNVLPAGTYQIVVAGGTGDHPDGEISYSSAQTCLGGCGSYSGTLELRGIRIVDQGFVLDLEILVSEISGDPWLFQSNLGRIALEINGQIYKPAASSFPAQVTSPGRMSGYLSFYDEIPLSEDTQYHVVLSIQNRLQPIEGWLSPQSP